MQLQQSEIGRSSVTFLFDELPVQVYVDDLGNAWFFAKGVFEALEITWSGSSTSLKNYPKSWQRVLQCQTPQGVQDAIFLSEAGLYKTLFNSRKPVARRFSEWVFEEVLPQLRKQGFFGTLSGADRSRISRELRQTLAELPKADAFSRELLLREIRCLCGLLGYRMPDTRLIGKDPNQLSLEGL